ncbi:MAG: cobalamin-binding protein [Thermoplasmata archaeon]|nr:cobalamin-binding protein [Thermoplasmata archaeon]
MRIVSLLPSATETVAALGRAKDLVGRSSECDVPRSVQRLPAVMRPRIWDPDRSSAEIDERVRGTRGAGESLYELDTPALARLQPDLVLTQDLCGVCSVTEAEVGAACEAAGIRPKVLSLSPRTLPEVAETIESIGAAIGQRARAEEMARAMLAETAPSIGRPARVAIVEWLDPPILAGLWAAEMVRSAGGVSIGPAEGKVGERTTWSSIRAREPELLVLAPCSFSVERSVRELARSPLGDELLARQVPRGTWLVDEGYFSRPGPRLVEGIRVLRSLLGVSRDDRPMAIQRWDPPSAREVAAS